MNKLLLAISREERYYFSSKGALYNLKKRIIGVVRIPINVTDRKKVEEQLKIATKAKEAAEIANQAKSDFLQSMQHDIRTSLSSIMMLMSTLKNKKIDDEMQESFELLESVCAQFSNLCRNFSNTNLDEEGVDRLNRQVVNIYTIANDIITLHRPAVCNKNIELKLQIAESVPASITSDEFRLRRILLNLLSNAVKFTDKGIVTLTIAMQENHSGQAILCIEVTDTGIGIAADKLPYIFNKYVRDSRLDEQKYPGTGLGLYSVKRFVEELGGQIKVESIVEQGTMIMVQLTL